MSSDKTSITSLLTELNINYVELECGDYQVDIPFSDGRLQSVFIQGSCETVNDVSFRTIWSPVYQGCDKPAPELLYQLLTNNHHRIVGAWMLDSDSNLLYFAAKVVDNFSAKELDAIITAVASDADRLEKKITGKDML